MSRPLKEIEQELLLLPQNERAQLAHRLIVSLDEDVDVDEGVESAWLEEVKKRDAEIERGEVQAVPYEAAMQSARDTLKEIKKK